MAEITEPFKERQVRVMLVGLTSSENKAIALLARELLDSPDFEVACRTVLVGDFMAAVLNGDFITAFQRADYPNRIAFMFMIAYAHGNDAWFPTTTKTAKAG